MVAEVSGAPLAGSLRAAWRDRLGLVEAARAAGDVARFRMGRRAVYVVSAPGPARTVLVDRAAAYRKGLGLEQARPLLGDGLLTAEGESWRRQRARVEPVFERSRVLAHAPAIEDAAGEMLDRWAKVRRVDVVADVRALTLQLLLRSLLGTGAQEVAPIGRATTHVIREAMRRMVFPVPLPTPGAVRARRALRLLERRAADLADERSAGDGLLNALAGDRDDARDQLVTMIVAGHETTAASLAWTLHLVATHPAALDAARAGEAGRRRVIRESLRLYPPVWVLPRRAIADEDVGGERIAAGADVLVCPYTIHRHPRFWERPDEMALDRPEGERAYLPFGLGPRACVGAAFARLELDIVLAMVTERFDLRPATAGAVKPSALLTLRPPDRLRLVVRSRAGT